MLVIMEPRIKIDMSNMSNETRRYEVATASSCGEGEGERRDVAPANSTLELHLLPFLSVCVVSVCVVACNIN
jgi:hypothetical protein